MLIHELNQPPKKVNEGLGNFFGLNNPKVASAWGKLGGELVQDLAARFTRDPRYDNMSLDQRKLAIARDEHIQEVAQKKLEEWNQYIANLQIKNGASLTDQQYKAALLNWANQSLFKGKMSELDPVAKNQANFHLDWIAEHRNDPKEMKKMLIALISNETARMVQVATDIKAAQAAATTLPKAKQTTPGQPTAPSLFGEPPNSSDPATAQILAALKAKGLI